MKVQRLLCCQRRSEDVLLLGKEPDKHVEVFLRQLRVNGVVINTAIVMATAEGVVHNKDSNLLAKKMVVPFVEKYALWTDN